MVRLTNLHNIIVLLSRYRIGQKHGVKIYRLIMYETIDQRIVDVQRRKLKLANLVCLSVEWTASRQEQLNVTEELLKMELKRVLLYKDSTQDFGNVLLHFLRDDKVKMFEKIEEIIISDDGDDEDNGDNDDDNDADGNDTEMSIMLISEEQRQQQQQQQRLQLQLQSAPQQQCHEGHTLSNSGFKIVRNQLSQHPTCVKNAKTLARYWLSHHKLKDWSFISGEYRQNLMMKCGSWNSNVVCDFGSDFLHDFENQLKQLVAS